MNVGNLICHKNKRMQVHGPSQDIVLYQGKTPLVLKKTYYENTMKSTFRNAAILKTV